MSARYTPKFVSFPEMDNDEERVVAILITKGDDGNYRAHSRSLDDHTDIDPEVLAMIVQHIELLRL